MKLLTEEIKSKLPKLYANEDKKPEDIPIICKFFDPTGSWTWYVTEGQKEGDDFTFFGFVRGFENEAGYFSLNELQSVKCHFGLGIERDKFFGKHTLAEVMGKRL